METTLLSEIINKIQLVKIAVIGDFCLDAYFFLNNSMSEISIETGLPTHAVQNQRYSLGGAGNLANNLITLGVQEVKAFGVVGNDIFGREMINIMREAGIRTDTMAMQDEKWSTNVYCKPVLNESELNRIDFGNFNILHLETENFLINRLSGEIIDTDVIIINQQVKSGIHTTSFIKKLQGLISTFADKIFISDIRDPAVFYHGTMLKLNETEAFTMCGIELDQKQSVSLEEAGIPAEILYKNVGRPVFITCGSKGSVAIDASGIVKIPGLIYLGRTDPVGAGDSYLAGAAASLAAGYDVGTVAEIGSFTAGVTVRKLLQTGTATPEEIYQIGTDPDYIYEPELAENIRKATYLQNTEIEIINKWPDNVVIRHAIFDHDGTISTLREGWELIMAPVMIQAILGNKFDKADNRIYNKVSERVNEVINKTTGVQTLIQMSALVDLIREFGFVPEEEILSIYDYKKIYNERLMNLVNKREKKLINGELSVDDLTIKNAVGMLNILFNAGTTMYLVSGTDEEDVKDEARVLGYGHYFRGGIYGATGDITKDAKKMVLENILKRIGDNCTEQIITFGDGPVEIRETRKKGGLTVGIASDEIKRYGLSEKKRTRLIQAGADIIIPDFTQINPLIGLLNLKKVD